MLPLHMLHKRKYYVLAIAGDSQFYVACAIVCCHLLLSMCLINLRVGCLHLNIRGYDILLLMKQFISYSLIKQLHIPENCYRARKNSDKYRIRLDLTKECLKIMGKANDLLKDMGRASESCYVFSDVNCRMCLKYDGKFQYFGNTNELLSFIESMESTEDQGNGKDASDENEEE